MSDNKDITLADIHALLEELAAKQRDNAIKLDRLQDCVSATQLILEWLCHHQGLDVGDDYQEKKQGED